MINILLHSLPPMVLNGILHVLLVLSNLLVAARNAVVFDGFDVTSFVFWQLVDWSWVVVVVVYIVSLQVWRVLVGFWVLVLVIHALVLDHLEGCSSKSSSMNDWLFWDAMVHWIVQAFVDSSIVVFTSSLPIIASFLWRIASVIKLS